MAENEVVISSDGTTLPYKTVLVKAAEETLTSEWQTTQEIARQLGLEWRPGSSDLLPLRRSLYALAVYGRAQHEERHNGHLWRSADA